MSFNAEASADPLDNLTDGELMQMYDNLVKSGATDLIGPSTFEPEEFAAIEEAVGGLSAGINVSDDFSQIIDIPLIETRSRRYADRVRLPFRIETTNSLIKAHKKVRGRAETRKLRRIIKRPPIPFTSMAHINADGLRFNDFGMQLCCGANNTCSNMVILVGRAVTCDVPRQQPTCSIHVLNYSTWLAPDGTPRWISPPPMPYIAPSRQELQRLRTFRP